MILPDKQYLTISQLTQYIATKFEKDPYLHQVYVTGEVSNFRKRPKHQYFSLKDDGAVLSSVMFSGAFNQLKFDLEDGMKVLAVGRIGVFNKSGNYQLYIDHLEPDGVGALYQKYEQLKQALTAEGLFHFEHKPIPRYPKNIAIVTSPSGAVIRDIITTVKRRFPIVQLTLYPTVVQGQYAADDIVNNLRRIEANGQYDTVIVGRGGGSIEDLWPFNEEKVVRAVSNMTIPVISSVGHETDTTLVDFVSDQRAATPTAAAEIATPVLTEELVRIQELQAKLYRAQANRIQYLNQRLLEQKNAYVFQQPLRLYEGHQLKLKNLVTRLVQAESNLLQGRKQRFNQADTKLNQVSPQVSIQRYKTQVEYITNQLKQGQVNQLTKHEYKVNNLMAQLDLLSPLKRMSKGFAYVTNKQVPVDSIAQVDIGDQLSVQFADGKVSAQITGIDKKQIIKK
ncbi:exodeoxyribonuclease VII large subunit [Aerococcus agrisoli]|uniref:exodeoxyribonuclease VII large subunit n=1 Tax=Aerococcus agrisoli TaxID=2487350 RepID=UPI0018F3735F|nr:exodeoxyribonuclease VII large subunit [Aerococcus agrisoli]